jgi:hypothetical protein
MSAKMLPPSVAESLQAQHVSLTSLQLSSTLLTVLQERTNTNHDAQTVVRRHAEDDSPYCEPREKVLNTTEVFEGILECFPLETLFMVQRVSRRFQDTITNSPRLQRKMFLRIENDHSLVWEAHHLGLGKIAFKQVPAKAKHERRTFLPVDLNPCFEREGRRPKSVVQSVQQTLANGSEGVQLRCLRAFTFRDVEHHSFGKVYFSDPQPTTILSKLCFALSRTTGIGLGPYAVITVRATVGSDAPLTVGAVVSRTLDTHGKVEVVWKHGARPSSDAPREGIPRDIIIELKRQTELKYQMDLDLSFAPSQFLFRLRDVVVPTEKERISAISDELEESMFT